jgi:DNA-binding ferritin-like protein
MLVHFRERIGLELINKINRQMVKNQRESQGEENPGKKLEEEAKNPRENRGKLILDASCAPGDISYPTDLNLLNQARKQTEKIIDLLYEGLKGNLKKKPRTYRILARKSYLEVARRKRPTSKQRQKAIKKQLQYLSRNLAHIDQLLSEGGDLKTLKKRDYKLLLVVAEIYRQQRWMYENKKQTIAARIISLSQPHIRPIVRGKVGKPVEFGAKLSASCFEGYVFLDHISWDNFNESGDFSRQVEAYYQYTGYYPESVHVDKIYRTRANRAWCKERGIRISGSPLGRPPKNVSKAQKKQAQEDERIRNCLE